MARWITPEKRLAIYMRDGFTCAYCGTDLRNVDARGITLDHLVPRNVKVAHGGGGNESTNLITACVSCNSSRQDKPWMDYATGGAIDRIETLRYKPLNVKLAKGILNGESNEEVEKIR